MSTWSGYGVGSALRQQGSVTRYLQTAGYGVCRVVLLLSLLQGLAGVPPAHATDYQYTAITVAPAAARQGAVRAAGLDWQCKANRCRLP